MSGSPTTPEQASFVNDPHEVLDFWFPDNGFWDNVDSFGAWINHRMQGGVDDDICTRFDGLTRAGALGLLDPWADTARGRLALILVLDQFPRSLWRDTPGAYAQDIKATRLALEGIANGHFASLKPWEMLFFTIAISHCEGPDHISRFDVIEEASETIIAKLPTELAPLADLLRAQNQRVREVVERFGRHPHRNAILGRISTSEETAYIETGDFPHLNKVDAD